MLYLNLFFVPMISVYIFYKLTKRPIEFSMQFVAIYMMVCVAVAVITKFILLLVRFLFSTPFVETTNTIYTIVAIIVSLIIPSFMSKISFSLKDTKK